MLDCTVIISVKNEERNIGKCLDHLVGHFSRILVLDSYSSDNTKAIASRYEVEIVDFDYVPPYPKKRQWALDNLVFATEWILLLDADELVGSCLLEEIALFLKQDRFDCAFIRKKFYFLGRRLKFGGFDFSALMLMRVGVCRFEEMSSVDNGYDMEIHERMIYDCASTHLRNGVEHLDWNSLSHYITKHNVYSTWEADVRTRLLKRIGIEPNLFGNVQQRRRFLKRIVIAMPFEPVIWFLYHYFFRLGFLHGYRGFLASFIRAFYIVLVRAKIFEKKL